MIGLDGCRNTSVKSNQINCPVINFRSIDNSFSAKPPETILPTATLMDHLPCSENHLWQHVRVPYLCQEEYDGLAFSDYPVRKGWQDAHSRALDLSRRSRDDQSAFLQTWLFFGMLTEVFGVPVSTQDFVKDDQVTTERLSEYTLRWHERLLSMSGARRQECHITAQQCLRTVRDHCLTLLDETTSDCPLNPEIRLSVRILGESLSQTKHWIWMSILGHNPPGYIDVRSKWGPSKLLGEMLLEKNWCPNHINFLEHYPPASSNSGLYYAARYIVQGWFIMKAVLSMHA